MLLQKKPDEVVGKYLTVQAGGEGREKREEMVKRGRREGKRGG